MINSGQKQSAPGNTSWEVYGGSGLGRGRRAAPRGRFLDNLLTYYETMGRCKLISKMGAVSEKACSLTVFIRTELNNLRISI